MKKEQIETIVNSYFGNVEHRSDVSMVGRMAYITISYTDFKPESKVITELLSLIPMAHIEIIERTYSDKAKIETLQEILDEGNAYVIINIGEDMFRKVPLALYLEEKLYIKNIF